jgi:hypothetical protein
MMIRVVLVLHVRIWGYMYMEVLRILITTFIMCYISYGVWAAMKFSAGTLTTNV